jgi:carnitine-CoA ligase
MDLVGNRNLTVLLAERAERFSDEEWLVVEDADGQDRRLTFAEFLAATQHVAGGLAELGIGPGDKVALNLANCTEGVIAFFAVGQLGAVTVWSNVANTAGELAYVLGHSDARMLVTSPDYLEVAERAMAQAPGVRQLVVARGAAPDGAVAFTDLLEHDPMTASPAVDPGAPAQMVFTSGTTARPKGVVITHANCLWEGERLSRGFGLEHWDRVLTVTPLFHVHGQAIALLGPLTAGATAISIERYRATRFWEQIRDHRATQTGLVGTILRTLLAQPKTERDGDHSLRRMFSSINVTDLEKAEFESRFGVELMNGYGSSEAFAMVTMTPLAGPQRWPSQGLPTLMRQVRIVDEDGRDVPAGTTGEIVFSGVPGRTIMKEYYKDPEATAKTIRDGWLFTGDLGHFDDFGYLYFEGRSKDVIKRAGENVSPTEVETALLEHPAVRQAAVVGVPDDFRDEAVMAFVGTGAGVELSEADLIDFCAERLAHFKVPTVVEVRESLPTTSVGKVEKRTLRDEVARRPREATPR